MTREDGFTVLELSVVSLLALALLGLGAGAIRHHWRVRSVEAAQDSLYAQMKEAQARSMAESHPRLYGLRLRPGSAPGVASSWGLVRYDYGAQTCVELASHRFEADAYVSAASFAVLSPGPTATCRSQIAGAATDQFVFLFARGSATAGSVTVKADGVSRTRTVTVDGITGRVART